MANELASLADMNVGSGLAQMGKSTVSLRKLYNDYVMSASEQGETPLKFDQWVNTQGNGNG